MADQTKTIAWRLIVETQGIERNTRAAANSLASLGKAASQMGSLLRISAGSAVIGGFIKLTDEYKNMQNRIKLVTSSSEEMRTVQARLLEVAGRTRVDVADTVELYGRAARSLQSYGLSQREIIGFTETVSQAIQVSGATAKEASQGVIQFSQGLASGKLAGDELRAVLEQMPRLGRAISDGMGVSYGSLRKLAAEGKITTKVLLDALHKEGPKLAQEFARMAPTVEQGWTAMKNEMKNLVGAIDEVLGTSAGLGKFFLEFGKGLHNRTKEILEWTISVRQWVAEATISVVVFFEKFVQKAEHARQTMKGVLGEIFDSDKMVEDAIATSNEIDKVIEGLRRGRKAEMEAIAADMAELRKKMFGTDADLDKKGAATEGLGGLTEEQLKLLAAWADKNDDLKDSLAELNAEQHALTIEMNEGKQAAADWLNLTQARFKANELVSDAIKKGTVLTDEQIDSFIALNEALAASQNTFSRRKEQISLTKSFTDENEKLNDSLAESSAEQHALSIAIEQGDEASESFLAGTQARAAAQATLNKWMDEGLELTDDQITAFLDLADAASDAARGVETNADAWETVKGGIGETMDQFELARLELAEFGAALSKVGSELSPEQLEAAGKRIRELAIQVSDSATLARDSLKTVITGFTDFLMEGTFDVKKFVKSMVQELGRLLVQFLIVRALKNSVLGAAQGEVFAGGGLVPFARGGVVSGPTTFPMSGGRTGLMGESGPEAVMPLARLPTGDLGVRSSPASIEVINKTGVNASARIQRQGDRTSIVLEAAELGAQIAEERMTRSMRMGYGSTAATMQRTYSLRRRG